MSMLIERAKAFAIAAHEACQQVRKFTEVLKDTPPAGMDKVCLSLPGRVDYK